MKRRTFLTTVGGAAGAAALSGCCTTAKTPTTPGQNPGGKGGRGQTATYGLSSVTPPDPDPNSPFKLNIRQPGWFPDGIDIGGQRKRLFLEELAGIKQNNVVESFPVEFDYTGKSKNWILGYP